MKTRFALLFAGLPLLSGCSSLGALLAFDRPPLAAEAPAPTTVAVAAAPDDTWCQRVAVSERTRAQASGFDAATLDRMTAQAFQQCRALSAN